MALWAGHQLNTALARGQPALKKTTPQHLWAMCEPSAVYCYIIWTVQYNPPRMIDIWCEL